MLTQKARELYAGAENSVRNSEWVVDMPAAAIYIEHKTGTIPEFRTIDRQAKYFNFIFDRTLEVEDAVDDILEGVADEFLQFSELQGTFYRRIRDARTALWGPR